MSTDGIVVLLLVVVLMMMIGICVLAAAMKTTAIKMDRIIALLEKKGEDWG